MNRLNHFQHHSRWAHVLILLAVLASVRPAHAAMSARLVKDINTFATGSSYPHDLTAVGNMLYFVVYGGTTGYQLWKSDGTADGTTLVKDITPNTEIDYIGPSVLTAVGVTLFFSANDGVHGRELWKSDGTEAGTTLVKDINPTGGSLDPYPYDFSLPKFTSVGSTLFFRADDGVHGRELWKSDGTAAGTSLVKDINSIGAMGSFSTFDFVTAVGNTLFFVADDGVHGAELWKSDGTAAGTTLVKDISSRRRGLSSDPVYLTALGSTLFFAADDGVHGRELWKSDGSATGTALVKDINPTLGAGSSPSDLTAMGNTLFFVADDGVHGYELWKSDGSSAGTTLVKDITPTGRFEPSSLTAVGHTLFFAGDDGTHGVEPWTSDGTLGGTTMVQDLSPGAASSDPATFRWVGTAVFFSAATSATGHELWVMEYHQVYLPLTRC